MSADLLDVMESAEAEAAAVGPALSGAPGEFDLDRARNDLTQAQIKALVESVSREVNNLSARSELPLVGAVIYTRRPTAAALVKRGLAEQAEGMWYAQLTETGAALASAFWMEANPDKPSPLELILKGLAERAEREKMAEYQELKREELAAEITRLLDEAGEKPLWEKNKKAATEIDHEDHCEGFHRPSRELTESVNRGWIDDLAFTEAVSLTMAQIATLLGIEIKK